MSSASGYPSPAPPVKLRLQYWGERILLVLMIVYVIGTAIRQGWRVLHTDFPNYYLAARLHVEGVPLDRAYEWDWFQRQKDARQIDQPIVAYAHPPLCALPFLPLAHLQPLQAKHVWITLNLIFLVIIVWLLTRTTGVPPVRVALLLLACVVPLRTCIVLGQYYIFILLLICLSFYFYKTQRWIASGSILALATALKLFPGLLVLVFLKQRNWRAFWATLAGTIGYTAIAVGVFGWEAHRVFFVELLPRSLSGDVLDPYSPGWSSWSGQWHRWFLFEPGLNPHPLLSSPLLYAILKAAIPVAALMLFYWVTKNWTEGERDWQWALAVTMSLFLSSIPSSYHYVLLVLPMCIAVAHMSSSTDRKILLLAFAGYLLLSLPIPNIPALRGAPKLAGTTLMFAALIAFCGRFKPSRASLAVAASLLAVLTAWSLWSIRGRNAALAEKIPDPLPSLSLSSPAISEASLSFSAMQGNDYELGVESAGHVRLIAAAGDVLTVAATPQRPEIYLEASRANSTIERLNGGSLEPVTNGESPSLSLDGGTLAFIREEKGRGTLWIRDLASKAERSITTSDYDVLEVSFSSNREMSMAGRYRNSAPQIFTVDLTGKIRLLPVPGRVRYPAISPDQKLLAFSRLDGSSWHLYIHDLKNDRESQLTYGNCNATQATWRNAHTVVFSSDCARGLGLTALATVNVK